MYASKVNIQELLIVVSGAFFHFDIWLCKSCADTENSAFKIM